MLWRAVASLSVSSLPTQKRAVGTVGFFLYGSAGTHARWPHLAALIRIMEAMVCPEKLHCSLRMKVPSEENPENSVAGPMVSKRFGATSGASKAFYKGRERRSGPQR